MKNKARMILPLVLAMGFDLDEPQKGWSTPIGPTPNKYKPHQGAKECARRIAPGTAAYRGGGGLRWE